MPIACQTIVDRCLAALDAEGSDRYIWSRDFVPAISSTNEWMISLFNASFSSKKFSEEVMNEVVRVRVWQTSLYSRFAFDSTVVGDQLWSILAIYTGITTVPASPVLAVATSESVYRSDISVVEPSGKSLQRLSAETWGEKSRNPFISGSGLFANTELNDGGYINFMNYTGGYTLINSPQEIGIAPAIPGQLIAMAYLKRPTTPVNIGDDLEFPESLTDMIVDKTLHYIAYKQGEAPLYAISDKSISQLVGLMT